MKNMFAEWLYSYRKFNIIRHIKFELFIRKLNKVAPDFDMLWQIANFVKILEVVFMYPNNKKSTLNSIDKYEHGVNGFSFTHLNTQFKFKLFEEDKHIHIDIVSTVDGKLKSAIKFKNGDASVITNEHDEQLFININDWLMNTVIIVLRHYYYRKFEDYTMTM